jgi:hypothetical protein
LYARDLSNLVNDIMGCNAGRFVDN